MDAAELDRRLDASRSEYDFGALGMVDVYPLVGIPREEELRPLAAAWLDAEERSRGVRFYRLADELRFLWRRLLARRMLAQAVRCSPAEIRYQHGPWGKPSLDTRHRDSSPHGLPWWNLSDSDQGIALALSWNGDVGVDLERHRDLTDFDLLARSIMHPREQQRWQGLAREQRKQWFFDLWAAKEAVLKCTGYGLSLPPREMIVDPEHPSGQPWTVSALGPDGRHWRCLVQLDRRLVGYSLAVARGEVSAGV